VPSPHAHTVRARPRAGDHLQRRIYAVGGCWLSKFNAPPPSPPQRQHKLAHPSRRCTVGERGVRRGPSDFLCMPQWGRRAVRTGVQTLCVVLASAITLPTLGAATNYRRHTEASQASTTSLRGATAYSGAPLSLTYDRWCERVLMYTLIVASSSRSHHRRVTAAAKYIHTTRRLQRGLARVPHRVLVLGLVLRPLNCRHRRLPSRCRCISS
jgi:hypothetical protein